MRKNRSCTVGARPVESDGKPGIAGGSSTSSFPVETISVNAHSADGIANFGPAAVRAIEESWGEFSRPRRRHSSPRRFKANVEREEGRCGLV